MSEKPEKKAAATLAYPATKSWAIMEKAPYYRWVVMILIFAVYSIATADRANLGMVLPYMKKEFGISNTEGGMLL
ncbi:MAG: hypothetical protein ACRDBM_11485, partial [Sporomusa sp.]